MNVISCLSCPCLPPSLSQMLSCGNYFLVGGCGCLLVVISTPTLPYTVGVMMITYILVTIACHRLPFWAILSTLIVTGDNYFLVGGCGLLVGVQLSSLHQPYHLLVIHYSSDTTNKHRQYKNLTSSNKDVWEFG